MDIEKAKAIALVDIANYIHQSVEIREILKKATGSVSIISLDSGTILAEKILPFDIFIHVIEGGAEITIDHQCTLVRAGQIIIIPGHTRNVIRTPVRCKILSVIIKGGYEELS